MVLSNGKISSYLYDKTSFYNLEPDLPSHRGWDLEHHIPWYLHFRELASVRRKIFLGYKSGEKSLLTFKRICMHAKEMESDLRSFLK